MQKWPSALAVIGGFLLTAAAFARYPGLAARYPAATAAAGILIMIAAVPHALFPTDDLRDEDGNRISPWYFILSEAHGGWSLARVQLMIWFVPAIVVYGALCIRDGRFVELGDQWAILLGLGGATTFFATSVTPSPELVREREEARGAGGEGPAPAAPGVPARKPAAPAGPKSPPPHLRAAGAPPDLLTAAPPPDLAAAAMPVAATSHPTFRADRVGLAIADLRGKGLRQEPVRIRRPNLRDLVTDFDDHGDMSRYQYLLLTLLGAGVLVVGAIRNGALPDVPAEFLYLVGASQTAYIGTKTVKRAAMGSANPAAKGGDKK